MRCWDHREEPPGVIKGGTGWCCQRHQRLEGGREGGAKPAPRTRWRQGELREKRGRGRPGSGGREVLLWAGRDVNAARCTRGKASKGASFLQLLLPEGCGATRGPPWGKAIPGPVCEVPFSYRWVLPFQRDSEINAKGLHTGDLSGPAPAADSSVRRRAGREGRKGFPPERADQTFKMKEKKVSPRNWKALAKSANQTISMRPRVRVRYSHDYPSSLIGVILENIIFRIF